MDRPRHFLDSRPNMSGPKSSSNGLLMGGNAAGLFAAANSLRTPPSLFARRLVAVRRAAYLAVVAARPHPWLILRRDWDLKDASYDHAVFEHVVVVLVPANWRALQDQWGHGSGCETLLISPLAMSLLCST